MDAMSEFDARDRNRRICERLEAFHGSASPLDRSMAKCPKTRTNFGVEREAWVDVFCDRISANALCRLSASAATDDR
jgi:hypothetical protein